LALVVLVEHRVLEQTVLILFLVLLLPQAVVAEPQTMEMVQRAALEAAVRLTAVQVRLELLVKALLVETEHPLGRAQVAAAAEQVA
jgi:hypothetical protein